MLLKKNTSCLVLIDVQEKLTPLVQQSKKLIARCQWLINLADEFGIPQIVSEQYPQGLGLTIAPLRALTLQKTVIEKVHFSCWGDLIFKQQLQSINKEQILLIGIETHVCVLQTALDLINASYQVFVVIDAVNSRYELDHNYGLKRMKQAGVELLTSEMVFFEWMEQAGTAEFKKLSKQFLNKAQANDLK